MFKKVKKLLVE